MMTNSSQEKQLKAKIMRNVWGIYLFRKATSPIALNTYILSILMWQFFLMVSMPHVFANMPRVTDPLHFVSFHVSAFLNTEPLVQVVAIGIIVLAIWLGRNIARNLRGKVYAGIGLRDQGV